MPCTHRTTLVVHFKFMNMHIYTIVCIIASEKSAREAKKLAKKGYS